MNAKFNHLIKGRKHIPRKNLGAYLRASELWDLIEAYISGIRAGQDLAKEKRK